MTTTLSTSGRIKQIVDLHELATLSAKKSIEYAIEIGQLLTEQKESLNHGEWIPWVEENLPFGETQARNYMRIHRNRQHVADLEDAPMREAVQMLATPREEPQDEIIVSEPDIVVELESVEDDDEPEEVTATRRQFDYGELCDTARRICTSTHSLYVRIIELQVQVKQLSRSGKDVVGAAWNKKDVDDLVKEIEKINNIFRKD